MTEHHGSGLVTTEFYCPACGHECVVAYHETMVPFETCECAECGGVMLEEEVA